GDDCIGTNEDEDGCNICCVLLPGCLELRRPLKQPKCGSRGEQNERDDTRREHHPAWSLLSASAEADPCGSAHQHELYSAGAADSPPILAKASGDVLFTLAVLALVSAIPNQNSSRPVAAIPASARNAAL